MPFVGYRDQEQSILTMTTKCSRTTGTPHTGVSFGATAELGLDNLNGGSQDQSTSATRREWPATRIQVLLLQYHFHRSRLCLPRHTQVSTAKEYMRMSQVITKAQKIAMPTHVDCTLPANRVGFRDLSNASSEHKHVSAQSIRSDSQEGGAGQVPARDAPCADTSRSAELGVGMCMNRDQYHDGILQ